MKDSSPSQPSGAAPARRKRVVAFKSTTEREGVMPDRGEARLLGSHEADASELLDAEETVLARAPDSAKPDVGGDELPGRRFPDLAAADQERARSELETRIAAYLKKGRPRVVFTDNVRTMLSVKQGHGVYTFRIHHMFSDAPSVVVRALGQYAQRQDDAASEMLRRFIEINEPKIRTDRRRRVTIDVAGRHHNLREIFDDLNEAYFGGAVKAQITWGPRTKRKRGRVSIRLGSYTVEDELIRIHPVLDAVDVPVWFVAGVVFHEMLHELHEMPMVGGRRVYHTREFKAAERRYEHYERCVLWERHNLDKLLER
jgi:hypothetical protein